MGDVVGLVLAGGAARRMGGGDKPLLDVGGRTMLERVIAVLAAEADSVALSANGDPARFAHFGLPVLDDGPLAGCGPMAGVLAGLEWAERLAGAALLTLPGDTPFVKAGIAAELGAPPACAESGGRLHPLIAVWPVAVREELRRWLRDGERRSARMFAAEIGMRAVAFPEARAMEFLNVNTGTELAAARESVRCQS